MNLPIKKAFVVVNPASGKHEPILNTFNTIFGKYNVEWDVAITKKYGDGLEFTKEAMKNDDYDIFIGYGGDGTQHELANALVGTDKLMGILPGGTGNGFAAGLDLSDKTEEALEIICTSERVISVDVVKVGDGYMLSRLYTGIDPEQQTSREMKDKYGLMAYMITGLERAKNQKPIKYTITVDGEVIEDDAIKCYVVNSGSTGINLKIGDFDPTDGILDVFTIDATAESLLAATDRFLHIKNEKAGLHYWTGKKILIEAETPQAVWADGEFVGRTPVEAELMPGALQVLVGAPKQPRRKRRK